MREKMWGIATQWDLLDILSPVFIYRGSNPRMSGKRSKISARSKMTEALDVHVSTLIYFAIRLIYSDMTEFILQ